MIRYVRTKDGIFYASDGVFGRRFLDKSGNEVEEPSGIIKESNRMADLFDMFLICGGKSNPLFVDACDYDRRSTVLKWNEHADVFVYGILMEDGKPRIVAKSDWKRIDGYELL